MKNDRQAAMNWWNGLKSCQKTEICDTHTELLSSPRRWESLTGREIEAIYKENINTLIQDSIDLDSWSK